MDTIPLDAATKLVAAGRFDNESAYNYSDCN